MVMENRVQIWIMYLMIVISDLPPQKVGGARMGMEGLTVGTDLSWKRRSRRCLATKNCG
jgi:hypothetical protein